MGRKKKDNEKYFAIRLSSSKQKYVPSTRCLASLDNWYETSCCPIYTFAESRKEEIKELLKNCFIYYAAFLYQDGTEEVWSAFKTKKEDGNLSLSFGGITFTL